MMGMNEDIVSPKEHEEYSDGGPRVESGGKNIVIFRPKCKMPSPNRILKDETYDRPWYEVDCARWRDVAEARKHQAEVRKSVKPGWQGLLG